MIRVLNLSGDAYTIGHQHGAQVTDLRPKIISTIKKRLDSFRENNESLEPYLQDITQTWQAHAPATLEMLHGIADALEISWEDFFPYTIASYLTNQLKHYDHIDGCTTWAASGAVTKDGTTLLAKNRDYLIEHQELQCLARVKPVDGHQYLCLTSAGSPGVFSSGINSAGLAVADTHVTSRDIGAGIARYSFMMYLLERFSKVTDAVSYLKTVPHFGDGTVILADAQGQMAVFEIAHTIQAVRFPTDGYLVSTNHFCALETKSRWVDTNPQHLQGNSLARNRKVAASLRNRTGQVDVTWAQALMRSHGSELDSICRHPELDAEGATISSVIFQPEKACMYVSNGRPCQNPFELFSVL